MLISFTIIVDLSEEPDHEDKDLTAGDFDNILNDLEHVLNKKGFDIYDSHWEEE